MVNFKVGDTLAGFRFHVKNPQTQQAINLTGLTVNFLFRIENGTLKTKTGISVTDPANGVCQHVWQSGDLYGAGTLTGELELVSGGQVGLVLTFTATIEKRV